MLSEQHGRVAREGAPSHMCKHACGGAKAIPFSGAELLFPAAIRFGQYAREANSLALVSRSGALTIKMTRRTATFKASEAASGPPPEQDIPLAVPKKTRLYVEQTQREREQALEMHRIFQRDLCKLRLTAARAYVKTISDGGSALATLTGASLRLNATVSGLGPNFKITIDVSVGAAAPRCRQHGDGLPVRLGHGSCLAVRRLWCGAGRKTFERPPSDDIYLATDAEHHNLHWLAWPLSPSRAPLQNVGTQLAMDVQVFFAYRLSRYMLPQSYLKIPLLVPVSAPLGWPVRAFLTSAELQLRGLSSPFVATLRFPSSRACPHYPF